MNLATSQSRWRIAPIVAIAAAVMMAVTFGARAGAADETISITAEGYSHQSVTILAGEKVTWTNDTGVTLSVTADGGAFDSGEIAPGETFEHTFTEPGTYTFSTEGDATFTGVVVVEAGGIGGNGDTQGLAAQTPAPPATGSGLESSGGVPAPLFIAVGLALLAIAGGSLALSRR